MDDIPLIPSETIEIHWKAISYIHTRSLLAIQLALVNSDSLWRTRMKQERATSN